MSLSLSAGLPFEPSPDAAVDAVRPVRRTAHAGRSDGLSPGQQRAVVGGIVALHVAVGYGLLQVQAVRDAVVEAAPIFVNLLAPPAPVQPPPPAPPPPPAQRVVPKKTPTPAPVIAAAPSPAPAAFTAPPPPPVVEPLPPIAQPVPVAEAAVPIPPAPAPPAPAPPAPPAPPKMIPPSAVQYLEPVMPVYSQASARAREHGRVVARFFIDEAGVPRDVGVYQSSGFVRLDEAWTAALRKARFKPPTLNGQPISGWATAAFDFQL